MNRMTRLVMGCICFAIWTDAARAQSRTGTVSPLDVLQSAERMHAEAQLAVRLAQANVTKTRDLLAAARKHAQTMKGKRDALDPEVHLFETRATVAAITARTALSVLEQSQSDFERTKKEWKLDCGKSYITFDRAYHAFVDAKRRLPEARKEEELSRSEYQKKKEPYDRLHKEFLLAEEDVRRAQEELHETEHRLHKEEKRLIAAAAERQAAHQIVSSRALNPPPDPLEPLVRKLLEEVKELRSEISPLQARMSAVESELRLLRIAGKNQADSLALLLNTANAISSMQDATQKQITMAKESLERAIRETTRCPPYCDTLLQTLLRPLQRLLLCFGTPALLKGLPTTNLGSPCGDPLNVPNCQFMEKHEFDKKSLLFYIVRSSFVH